MTDGFARPRQRDARGRDVGHFAAQRGGPFNRLRRPRGGRCRRRERRARVEAAAAEDAPLLPVAREPVRRVGRESRASGSFAVRMAETSSPYPGRQAIERGLRFPPGRCARRNNRSTPPLGAPLPPNLRNSGGATASRRGCRRAAARPRGRRSRARTGAGTTRPVVGGGGGAARAARARAAAAPATRRFPARSTAGQARKGRAARAGGRPSARRPSAAASSKIRRGPRPSSSHSRTPAGFWPEEVDQADGEPVGVLGADQPADAGRCLEQAKRNTPGRELEGGREARDAASDNDDQNNYQLPTTNCQATPNAQLSRNAQKVGFGTWECLGGGSWQLGIVAELTSSSSDGRISPVAAHLRAACSAGRRGQGQDVARPAVGASQHVVGGGEEP